MRGLAVLTVVFVFASSALFVGPASAQSTSGLKGMVCMSYPYAAKEPAYGGNASSDAQCYSQGIPGATITLSSGSLPVVGSVAQRSATSDSSGYYVFQELASGDYSFAVERKGFQTLTGTLNVGSDGTYRDFAIAGAAITATGHVAGPDGAIAGAEVGICCDDAGERWSGSTDASGDFAIEAVGGWRSVDVNAAGFYPTSQHLLVDGALPDFRVERIPPQDAKVAGRVVDQDGDPVAGAFVELYSYNHGGCCYAYPATMSYRPSYMGGNVTETDADGRFSMSAYSGGNSLSVNKPGYASHSRSLELAAGKTSSVDVELLKFPDKTARMVGQVVDAKTGKGLANAYVSLQSPEYGINECSQPASSGTETSSPSSGSDTSSPTSGSGSAGSSGGATADSIAPSEPYPYYPQECAIKVRADGSFEGLVSPGYAILSVWVDNYASCAESRDADGSFTRTCGPEYYSFSKSLVLPGDETTRIDAKMRSRPAPDAEVSGYVIDAETRKAIPGASISFSNQDTYGYGSATTDQDGSYRLRLRSGYHQVTVWAEGHLRWEGFIDVAKGDSPFDVEVQPGTESYGYCCPGPYYGGVAYSEDAAVKSSGGMTMSATGTSAPGAPNAAPQADGASGAGASSQGEQYQDLGGGLGPYDPAKRSDELEEANGAPGLGLIAALAAIGAVLALRRRLA